MDELTMEFINKNIPKLGFGLMRLPLQSGTREIDMEHVKKMVDCYMEAGMNYFDTAYMYHDGKSEVAFREAVVKRYPREDYTIATKLPIWFASNAGDVQKIFDEQLRRTSVDYFDFYLHHSLNADNDSKTISLNGYELVKKLKAQGRIRHIGFSFHGDAKTLKKILTEQPQMEFVQLQINYLDWDDSARELYEIARSFNKPIIIMEPVKGGILAKMHKSISKVFTEANPDASAASWALRYCASLDGILTTLSGMSNMDQMKDNIDVMKDFKPLTEQERGAIETVTQRFREASDIQCTACNYCSDCPVGIPISSIFKIYNDFVGGQFLWQLEQNYDEIPEDKRADKCIHCGKCESVCPQRINIISKMEAIAALLQ